MSNVERKQYLIYELTAVNVVANEDLGPQLRLATFDEIAGLLLEHRVVVGDSNKLIVAESFGVRDVRQVRVPCFAELSDDEGLIQLKQGQESQHQVNSVIYTTLHCFL